ncbi:MAG: phosphoribosylanthranilate isomerase [Bacteroidales bacterium]|nr:phosphoribosylanthranilate isomerase [Bacteroidales bacterium]
MKDGKLIKVCGMTDGDNIRRAEALGADLIGFIFYPKSPRKVRALPSFLPRKSVGVFVNSSYEEIMVQNIRFGFQYVQLHGKETPAFCRELRDCGFKVIKAFSIATERDVRLTKDYEDCCDYFLFDTKCDSVGGSGRTFDWAILRKYEGRTPFLLSGGLSLDNIEEIRAFSHPKLAGYDLNSKFETEPGIKDIEKLKEFIEKI